MSSKWSSTESTVKAWTPEEVRAQKVNFIPPEIIEAVNELLAEKYNGTSASMFMEDIIVLAKRKMKLNHSAGADSDFCEKGWMDFEPIFENAGWHCECDSPGYNESYRTHFKFKRKTR